MVDQLERVLPAVEEARSPTRWHSTPTTTEALLLASVTLAGLGSSIARSTSTITHPQLFAEDGTVWFRHAYNNGWLVPLTQAHTGYLQSFPRLIADLGLLVPLRALPLFFVIVSLIVQVLPAVLVVSNRFAPLIPSRSFRVVVAGLYFALPNSSEVNINLTNAEWHLGLLALLVLLASPGQRVWKTFDVVVVVLCALTGPFTIALLPIAAIVWWTRRDQWTVRLLAIIGPLTVLQLIELATSPRGHFGPLGATWSHLVEILGGQIVIGTVLGTSTLMDIQHGPHFIAFSICFLVAAGIVVGCAVIYGPTELRAFNLFAALLLAAALATPVASVGRSQWQVLATQGGIRYWFFPALALIVDFLWLVSQRRSRVIASVGIGVLVIVIGFGVREDWRYPVQQDMHWAAQVQQFSMAHSGQRFLFSITPGHWRVELTKH